MNQAVKFQLGLGAMVIIYYLVRLLGISDHGLNIWQQIYWGNLIRNSFLLLLTFLLFYQIFNQARKMPITGPTLVKGSLLKKLLFIFFGLGWLAVVTHTIFDSLKILLPLELLPLYQFADLMDETIAHLFMHIPIQLGFFLLTLLEIQRPSSTPLVRKNLVILIISSSLTGLLWGLNLSEGNFSIYFSLPTVIIYLIITTYLIKHFRIKLTNRPWTLYSLITSASIAISFSVWSLIHSSSTQFFSTLK
jgi:hypothetical protein